MTKRQVFQSIVQFLIVFFTALLVFDHVPTSLDQVWQPFVQAMLAALSIWAASKSTVGGAATTPTERIEERKERVLESDSV